MDDSPQSLESGIFLKRVHKLYPDATSAPDGWVGVGGAAGAFVRVRDDCVEIAFPDCSGFGDPARMGEPRPGAVWRSTRLSRLFDEPTLGKFLGRAFRARARQFLSCEWCGRLVPGECTAGWTMEDNFCQSCFDRLDAEHSAKD